jgi:hypothetical protein
MVGVAFQGNRTPKGIFSNREREHKTEPSFEDLPFLPFLRDVLCQIDGNF